MLLAAIKCLCNFASKPAEFLLVPLKRSNLVQLLDMNILPCVMMDNYINKIVMGKK